MKKIILLIDVDGKMANLALMKLSSYYKSKGCNVELVRLEFNYYKDRDPVRVDCSKYEEVFVSTLFEINKGKVIVDNCDRVTFGGTGNSLVVTLTEEVEQCEPDYGLYPECDYALGFITRGCIRNCYFCVVPEKEGMIKFNMHPKDIIGSFKKVRFLDNNILAYKKHMEILKWLKDRRVRCKFVSGFDIRLINHDNAKVISELNYDGDYFFAFDDYSLLDVVNEKLKILKEHIKYSWDIKFFLYCNPNMKLFEVVKRVNWCKENKVLPYFMRDKTCWKSEHNQFYVDLACWCNDPRLFKKLNFEQFLSKRHTKQERIKKSLKLYLDNC